MNIPLYQYNENIPVLEVRCERELALADHSFF